MSDYPRTCRFCRKTGDGLVKYGTRHYAHTGCLVAAQGEAALLELPVGVLGAVEVFKVSEETREAILAKMAATS